jgi:hypothetical protein
MNTNEYILKCHKEAKENEKKIKGWDSSHTEVYMFGIICALGNTMIMGRAFISQMEAVDYGKRFCPQLDIQPK